MPVLISFPVLEIVRGIANVWSLGLLLAAAAALLWFLYTACLRRLLRVRRIANIRLKRILEENQQSEK